MGKKKDFVKEETVKRIKTLHKKYSTKEELMNSKEFISLQTHYINGFERSHLDTIVDMCLNDNTIEEIKFVTENGGNIMKSAETKKTTANPVEEETETIFLLRDKSIVDAGEPVEVILGDPDDESNQNEAVEPTVNVEEIIKEVVAEKPKRRFKLARHYDEPKESSKEDTEVTSEDVKELTSIATELLELMKNGSNNKFMTKLISELKESESPTSKIDLLEQKRLELKEREKKVSEEAKRINTTQFKFPKSAAIPKTKADVLLKPVSEVKTEPEVKREEPKKEELPIQFRVFNDLLSDVVNKMNERERAKRKAK